MKEINLPICQLRPYQKDWWHAFFVDQYKKMVLVCHRRSGKDLFCINLIAAAMQERVGTYLYLLPEQAHAKRIIWDGIIAGGKRFLDYFPRELIKRINNSEMIIEYKNGSIFRLGGSDQYNKQVGTNPVLIIFGDYALHKPTAWGYLSPILVENKGKVIFQFTPRSYNHAYDLYMMAVKNSKWYVSKLGIADTQKSDGSPAVTQEDINEQLAEGFDAALIDQEYNVSFEGPNTGSYFGKFLTEAMENKRIFDFPIKSEYPVYTSWDIGMNNSTTIWFWQEYGGLYHFINAYDNTDEGVEHYYLYLIEFAAKYKLSYATHNAPHDVKVREWGAGKTRIQQAFELGLYLKDVVKLGINDGIARVRRLFPRCVFHETNCKKGLKALREYRREWNADRKYYVDSPFKDWSTDYADSFRYFAVSVLMENVSNKNPNTAPIPYD